MQKLQPSAVDQKARPYTHRPLTTRVNDRPTFRFLDLLRAKYDTDPLRCRIIHASLGEIQYYALSYTWGEPIFNSTLIVLEGWNGGIKEEFEIPITASLDIALRRMRIDFAGKMLLWADAVSINQADIAERTSQVQLMGDIFSFAQRVLIWTGLDNRMKEGAKCLESLSRLYNIKAAHGEEGSLPVCVNSVPQFRYLDDSDDINKTESSADKITEGLEKKQIDALPASQHQDEYTRFVKYEDPTSKWTLFSGAEKYEYGLFTKFFTRPYFSRRWIIQEVALAKEISLYCGGAVMTEKVVSAVGELHSLPTREWHGSDGAFAFLAMLTRLGKDVLSSPFSVLRAFPNFQCRDPKDHVFAMLGVFKSKLENGLKFPQHVLMTASYENSIEDVYTALAKYQLDYYPNCAGVFELLAIAGALRSSTGDESISRLSLPTWVPDWRCSQRYVPCSSRVSYAYVKYRSTMYSEPYSEPVPTIITQSGILQTFGHKIDTIVECIKCNLLDPSGREHLQSRLDGWFANEYYQQFYNSAREVISDAIVTHCYKNFPPEYCSFWLFDNKSKVFDAMSHMQEHDTAEFQDFLNILPMVMKGRSFILTGSGYVGISCEDSEPGDNIFMIRDGYMTFVMRNSSKNVLTTENLISTYKLIGDAYIHRLADVQAHRLYVTRSGQGSALLIE